MPIKQVFEFTPAELWEWRRTRKIKAYQLAEMLDVSRNTISRWETGATPMPRWLHAKLEELAFKLIPKPVAAPPEAVDRDSAELRPDLDLFNRASRNGIGGLGSEHPAVLLPDLLPKKAGVHHIPWSVLESEEYLTALRRKRGETL